MNRETWLDTAVERMRVWFEAEGYPLPEKVLVSVGWPKLQGGKSKPIGQAFDPRWTADGTAQIFICPTLGDPIKVLDVLLHELCHLGVGVEIGHAGPFVTLIRTFGLQGKATNTYCSEGSPLWERLNELAGELGEYNHSQMQNIKLHATRAPGGGWVKFRSPVLKDDYILRVSPRSLALHGAPRDPAGNLMERC